MNKKQIATGVLATLFIGGTAVNNISLRNDLEYTSIRVSEMSESIESLEGDLADAQYKKEGLQERIVQYEENRQNLKDQIGHLEGSVQQLEDNIGRLQSDNQNLRSENERLGKEYAEVQARREAERAKQAEQQRQAQSQQARSTNASTNTSSSASASSNTSVSQADRRLLAQLVHAEGRGESFQGQVAIVEVVLNRMNDGRFPSTVHSVIHQQGQFDPVRDGSIRNNPTDEAFRAVDRALQGSSYTNGAVFFWNPRTATNRWLSGRRVVANIGNHQFLV